MESETSGRAHKQCHQSCVFCTLWGAKPALKDARGRELTRLAQHLTQVRPLSGPLFSWQKGVRAFSGDTEQWQNFSFSGGKVSVRVHFISARGGWCRGSSTWMACFSSRDDGNSFTSAREMAMNRPRVHLVGILPVSHAVRIWSRQTLSCVRS